MIKTDPTQSLVIDCFNPTIACNIMISGLFRHGEDLTYMTRNIPVPTYVAGPTQLVIPMHYDEVMSISCWKPVTPAGHSSCFVHCYVIQGPLANNIRINSLFAGWVTDGNPISYPLSDREDTEEVLSGYIERAGVVLPTPLCTLAPPLGMPFKVVAFYGTYTCSVVAGNRNIGLGVDDGAGNFLQVNYNPTNFPALSVVQVNASNNYAQPFTAGNNITVPLPDMIIAQPRFFSSNVLNADINDAWANAVVVIRPYVDF